MSAETARSVLLLSTHRTAPKGFDQTITQRSRTGVEPGSRREQQISTGEKSARRSGSRGICQIKKLQNITW